MTDPARYREAWLAGWPLVVFDAIDSTNDEARRRAALGAPGGLVILAARQNAGRGRRGRAWVSVPGNLTASVLLRPAVVPARAAELSFVAALALHEALLTLCPVGQGRLTLKWPNDLLLDGAKLAGILIEAANGPDGLVDHLVIGFGVNLAGHPDDTPYPATAIAARLGRAPEPLALLEALVPRLRETVAAWETAGFAPVRTAWLALAHGLDRPITVRLGDATLDGIFRGLDQRGALQLERPDGGIQLVAAGDVFPARAAS